jgi:carboxypeptidase D
MLTGTLLAIQNMTWGDKQGFQDNITDTFHVPLSTDENRQMNGAGPMGKTRTERGLTFSSVRLNGHMVPQFQPGAVFRLLGRVANLTTYGGFTVGK